MESWGLLAQIVALLAAALVLGGVMARLRQSPLLGYIVAGMVLGGPGSLGLVESEAEIAVIAEIGVSLLLFGLGLEFSYSRLRSFGTRWLLGGVVQIVATAAVALVASLALGLGMAESVAVGAMLSLSSTAAVLRVLGEQGEVDSLHGRASIAVLLTQDIALVPFAVLITLLAGESTGTAALLDVGRVLGLGVGLVVALYVVLNKVAVRALGALSLERNRELTVLLAVVVGLGSTWAAHAVGLSPALGAFVAGMILGGSPFATQVRSDVSSLRVVLVTLFFAAVGMLADPLWIADNALLVLGFSVVVVVGKAAVVLVALRALGLPRGVSLGAALCLAQIGEFAFVLGGAGVETGVVSEGTYMLVVSGAIVSLFVTPYLVVSAPRAAAWIERRLGGIPSPAVDGHGGHPAAEVVIIGYGPAGQAVGRALATRRIPAVVLDLNTEARTAAERIGHRVEIGDALQPDVLLHAGVDRARWVVITLPARSAAHAALETVRAMNPNAFLIVRARYQMHQKDFLAAGAHVVVDDEIESGRALAAAMMEALE